MLVCYMGNGKPNNAAVSATHPTVHAALSSLLVIMTGLVGEKEMHGDIVVWHRRMRWVMVSSTGRCFEHQIWDCETP